MKLIDLLVQELPKRGGWPDGSTRCMQTDGMYVTFPDIGDHCDFVAKCMADGVRIATRDQYEAALAARQAPTAADEGWIEWHGGECPLEYGTLVDVRDRDGYVWKHQTIGKTNEVNNIFWMRGKCGLSDSEIIAYRLHQSKHYSSSWDGYGLPPTGIEVEYKFKNVSYRNEFSRGFVIAFGVEKAFILHKSSNNEFIHPLKDIEFRPIRTEAERKRDETLCAMRNCVSNFNNTSVIHAIEQCYDAIAAGKIPGIKLENAQ